MKKKFYSWEECMQLREVNVRSNKVIHSHNYVMLNDDEMKCHLCSL